MKKYYWVKIIAVTITIVSLCSCTKQPDTLDENSSLFNISTLNWTIALSDSSLTQDFNSYPVIKELLKIADVKVTFDILDEDYGLILLKRFQSGVYPDLLTVALDDPINKKLAKLSRFCTLDKIPEITKVLPKSVIDYHTKQNLLGFVPGGFGQENLKIASEGWYINSYLNKQIGLPNIKSSSDIINAISSYKKWCDSNKNSLQQDFLPILGGRNNQGWDVLEHLFGITPTQKRITKDIQTLPDSYMELIAFLNKLGKAGVRPDMLNIKGITSTKQMSEALFYVGKAYSIESYNRIYPEKIFLPLQPVLDNSGYLNGYSPYGVYATYISCEDKRIDYIEKLITTFLSQKGSNTAILGVENQDWLMDDFRNVILFSDTKNKILKNDYKFINNTGIGVFPFLSSTGIKYPGTGSGENLPVQDILAEINKYQIDPTSELGIKQSKYEAFLRNSCETALLSGAN